MTFLEKLEQSTTSHDSLLSIGLDPTLSKIPTSIQQNGNPLFEFNKAIIDATHETVCVYKPNTAFYEALGSKGIEQLKQTIDYVKNNYPDIPVIADAKRADIGNTSEKYAAFVFEYLKADAVTVNPYMGRDSLEPFFAYKDKGIIVLCRTSNDGATDFQDIDVQGEPFYIRVAQKISNWHKQYGNCLMVVGATWPEELKEIRSITNDMVFLIPGIGTQGGNLEDTLMNGLQEDKKGLIIHSGRSIIYASNEDDFAKKAYEEALELKDQINTIRYGNS